MTGFVYVIESSSGRFKVGYSNDPHKRLGQLATATSDTLTLRAAVPGTMDDEQGLHEALAPWRVGREWFSDCLPIRALCSQGDAALGAVAPPMTAPKRITTEQILTSLLSRIDAYVACSGMSESTLGREAVNDDRFIPRLRQSGACTFKTYQRLDEWLWAREQSSATAPAMERAS